MVGATVNGNKFFGLPVFWAGISEPAMEIKKAKFQVIRSCGLAYTAPRVPLLGRVEKLPLQKVRTPMSDFQLGYFHWAHMDKFLWDLILGCTLRDPE